VSKKLSLGGGGGWQLSPPLNRKNYRAILKKIRFGFINLLVVTIERFKYNRLL
jgi:hypothetical protein